MSPKTHSSGVLLTFHKNVGAQVQGEWRGVCSSKSCSTLLMPGTWYDARYDVRITNLSPKNEGAFVTGSPSRTEERSLQAQRRSIHY